MSAHKLKPNGTHQFEHILKIVESNIEKQLDHLKKINLPVLKTINFDNIFDPFLEESAETIKMKLGLPEIGRQTIYIFKLAYPFKNAAELKNKIDKICDEIDKGDDRHTRITGINHQNLNYRLENFEEVILYVGTSKSFASRLKDHIGHGSDDTSALCLKIWSIFQESEAKLVLEFYEFEKGIESESLKLFEFFLSKELRPLMGRNRKA